MTTNTGCGPCADYLSRRAQVLGPEIDLRAFIRGVRPEVVIREFMHGVHQRHLSGPVPHHGWGRVMQCPSTTGPGPCMNPEPHTAPRGCVHHSTSGVPDRHDQPGRGDGE